MLVTGFDPFGRLHHNPSARLVEYLRAEFGGRIETAILPTSYRRAWTELQALLEARNPTALLMFGYTHDATGLRLEKYARNRDNARAIDNDGQLGTTPIVSGAPARLVSTVALPVFEYLLAKGAPVTFSTNAGGYVCNHLYYRVLLQREAALSPRSTLFVHVSSWERSAERESILHGARLLTTLFVEGAFRTAPTPRSDA